MTAAAPLLSIDGVSMRFGGIVALDGVSFDVGAGQICGFIGPERIRQDDAVQLPQPALHAAIRRDPVPGYEAQQPCRATP